MRSRILYISGNPDDARHLSHMLQPLPLLLDHVESLQLARERLRSEDYDVVLTEAQLPDGKWQNHFGFHGNHTLLMLQLSFYDQKLLMNDVHMIFFIGRRRNNRVGYARFILEA